MQNKWALILGASSGFGAATARKLAQDGFDIIGIHLDRRPTMPLADQVRDDIRNLGRKALFFNINAADSMKRREVIGELKIILGENNEKIAVMLHSLAFGALKPLFGENAEESLQQNQLEMTLDVMANSLIYWTQDLYFSQLFAGKARIFALSSAGSKVQWPAYGAVSAAKTALESYCRQITFELASQGITANTLLAGVTDTPALRKIPGNEDMINTALSHNPSQRLTNPDDVAGAVSALSREDAFWIAGDTITVDGGELIGG